MAIGYCKLQPHRIVLVLAKRTDGDGDRGELLKAVNKHE